MLLLSLGTVLAHLGDLQLCREIYERLLPFGKYNVLAGPHGTVCFGPVARVLGVLADALESWLQADEHFQSAADLCVSLGSPPWLVYTKRAHGLMLRRRDWAGDRRRASALIAEGNALARRLGMSLRPSKGGG